MSTPKSNSVKSSGYGVLITKPLHNLRVPKPLRGQITIANDLVEFRNNEGNHLTLPMDSVICVSWESEADGQKKG